MNKFPSLMPSKPARPNHLSEWECGAISFQNILMLHNTNFCEATPGSMKVFRWNLFFSPFLLLLLLLSGIKSINFAQLKWFSNLLEGVTMLLPNGEYNASELANYHKIFCEILTLCTPITQGISICHHMSKNITSNWIEMYRAFLGKFTTHFGNWCRFDPVW